MQIPVSVTTEHRLTSHVSTVNVVALERKRKASERPHSSCCSSWLVVFDFEDDFFFISQLVTRHSSLTTTFHRPSLWSVENKYSHEEETDEEDRHVLILSPTLSLVDVQTHSLFSHDWSCPISSVDLEEIRTCTASSSDARLSATFPASSSSCVLHQETLFVTRRVSASAHPPPRCAPSSSAPTSPITR